MKTKKMTAYCAAVCFLVPLLFFSNHVQAQAKEVKVIEIRNYLLKDGQREAYIEGFENYFVDTLNAEGNYVLGQFRIKGEDNRFVWIRGFDDMATRKEALQNFFGTKHWEKYKHIPGNLLVGYTNVHLLKPLHLADETGDSESGFPIAWFGRPKGVAVVDFYIANEMRDQLIGFVNTTYDSLMHAAGVKDISYWVSETSPNNYPSLPVFQDKNLLVSITFYKDEQEYEETRKRVEASMNEETKFIFGRIVTTRTTWVLYPTERSFTAEAGGEKKR